MIIVVGSPEFVPANGDERADVGGLAARVAASAAGGGAKVELVGKVGDDAPGDEIVVTLSRLGVGHAALLRVPGWVTPTAPRLPDENGPLPAEERVGEGTPAREGARESPEPRSQSASTAGLQLEPADVELALRYLDGFDVLVVAEPLREDALATVLDAVGYASARLVVIVPHGGTSPELPSDAIALGAPPEDPDGVFAETVGRLAVALDRGRTANEAIQSAAEAAGWQLTKH